MADKRFSIQIDVQGNIAPIKGALGDLQKIFSGLTMPASLQTSIEKTFGRLSSEIQNFEAMANKGFTNMGDIGKAEKSFGNILTLFENLKIQAGQVKGLDPEKLVPKATLDKIKEVSNAWDKLNSELSKKSDHQKNIDNTSEAYEAQLKEIQKLEKAQNKLKIAQQTTRENKQAKSAELQELEARKNAINEEIKARQALKAAGEKDASKTAITGLREEANEVSKDINRIKNEISSLNKTMDANAPKIAVNEEELKQATVEAENLKKKLEELKTIDTSSNGLNTLRDQVSQLTGLPLDKIPNNLNEIKTILANFQSSTLQKAAQDANNFASNIENASDSTKKMNKTLEDTRQSAKGFMTAAEEVDHLRTRLAYFFSIGNSVQLFKRAIRSALNTVKELDAVMTETAVVTDFTVGDMWDKLPQYAEKASALGASIKDLYSATTLYYQQGLQTDAAMGVGVETMKMARIAGMEAAEATQAMTAALRGFNMEVNEMNAQVVNDVYSELAAITAADTSQIATAMTKTASIASSANMEFETTAALLAQIIETTQEAPETAGTAMKTIIARFTEVKQLFSEGMLTGEDEEGETININKIDAALKTVGISLKDFLTGSKGIDDIFLELASKWDTLDLATQRYIATTAAGSRQQSRFIAMMSNYDRTMELVGAAQNSAGASQEQFNKTLDSMEAKLQNLSNAWNQFLMGLANNDILKGGIDLLTNLLNTINNITNSLSGGNGLGKSLVSFMAIIGALKGGKALLGGAFRWMGTQMGMSPPTAIELQQQQLMGSKLFGDDPSKIAAIEGQKAGTTFAQSASRALASGKQQKSFSAGLKSFFTLDQMVDTKKLWTKEDFFDEANLINRGKNLTQVKQAYDVGGIDAANAKLKELGLQSVNTSQMMRTIPINFQAIGMAAMGIGGILGMIANHFEKIGNTEAAEKISKVSTVLMGLGSVLTMVNMIIPGLGNAFSIAGGKIVIAGVASQAAWWWLLIIPAAIAAVAAAAGALYKAAYNASPEGKLKKITEESEQAEEAAKSAAEGYNELKTALDSLKEQENTLETLTRGTTEWKEAVQSLNDEVLTLIENNPSLAPFVMSKGGILGLDYNKTILNDKGQATTVESILEKEAKQSLTAQTTSLQIQKRVAQIRASNYFTQEEQTYGTPEFNGVITATKDNKWGNSKNPKVDIFEEETNQLADLIATGQIKNYSEMVDYVKKLDLEGYGQARVAEGFEGSEATFLQLKQYGKLRQQNEAKEQAYNRAISNNLIETATLTESQREMMSSLDPSVIMDGYNKILKNEEENLKDLKITDDVKELYADLAGYTYDRSTKRFYSGEGENKVDVTDQISDENIRSGLATENAMDIYASKLEQISSTLVGKTTEQQELILATVGDSTNMSADILKEFGTWNKETGIFDFNQGENGEGFEALAKQMGFDSLQAYADAFGTDIETAKSTIIKSFEKNGDAFVKRRKDLVHKMSKYSEDGTKGYEWNATQLAALEAKFGEQFVGVLEGVFTSLELSGNEELISTGANIFKTVALAGTEQDTKKISDFIGEVNWGNSIEAAAALRKEIEYGTGAAKAYAKAMMDANLNYLSIGSQTQTLFQSEQFGEIQGELEEILNTSQEIGASDVNDLAKSYKILDNYLKNTEVTASGLAKALTEVQKGSLTFDQLTTSVMSALSSFNSLDDTVADILGKLEEFDLGLDENQIAGKIGEFNEVLGGNLKKGAYGNSQNFKILDFMFGPNWDKTWNEETKRFDQLVGDDLTKRMKELNKQLGKNTENMLASWKQLAENQDIYGKAIEFEGEYKISPTVKYENGEILLENFEGMTTSELTSWIADAYNVSKEYAQMMLADFKNYSDDLAIELMQNDYAAGIDAAYESLNKIRGATDMYSSGAYVGKGEVWLKAIDENEIQAIATALGELPEKVRKDFEAKGAIITNFYDEDGILKRGRELFDELNRLYKDSGGKGKWEDKYFEESKLMFEGSPYAYYSNAKFDYEAFNKDLDNYGFTDQQKVQITQDAIDQQIQNTGKPVDIEVKLSDGSMKTLTLQAGESFEEAYAQADLEQQNKNLGDAIAESLGTIEWKVDESSAASAQEIINTMKEAAAEPIALTANADGVATAWNTWRDSIDTNIVMSASISPASVSIGAEGGGSFTVSIAQLAKGIKNAPSSFDALTGEEGPELVQTKDGAYLVGQNGPEMAHINKGDTVYTADETKKIMRGSSHKQMPRFATGYSGADTGGSGISKVGDGKKDIDVDKLYNILADIEEALRTREKLEREYTAILDRLNTNAKDLVEQSKKQIAALEDERTRQEARKEARINQSDAYMEENASYKKYAWVETRDDGERVVQIDWDAINNISNDKEKENVQEYLSNIEKFEDDINEAEDAIIEIDDAVKEIKERGKDEYFDLEKQIKEALVNDRQKEIDKLSEINDSINDTNSRLLEAMSYSIEQQRQARENDKTEQEISDKQRQLAYLQQDTSGANALDIMKLQKEIDETQEDYTDTLIDQKISELQKQNDDAATQRQQQIDIAQAQLDHYVESGQVWKDVYDLMNTGIGPDGAIIDNSGLMDLLKKDADFASMSNLEKLKWGEELNDKVGQALAWLDIGNQLEDVGKTEGPITFTAKDAQGNVHTVTGTVNSDGSVTTAEGATYSGVYQNYDGSYTTSEEWIDPATIQQQVEETVPEEPPKPEITEDVLRGVASAIWRGDLGWGTGSERMLKLTEIFGADNAAKIKRYVDKYDYKQFDPSFSIAPEHSYNKMKEMFGTSGETYSGSGYNSGSIKSNPYYTSNQVAERDDSKGENWIYDPSNPSAPWRKKFATGGLADFTGPAWLDGTKSRPEYVLNADQTQRFFALVDVLESLRGGTSKTSENRGDNTYDIDINVESIGSDYDVEQLATTVKRLIAEDARYRNNNTINLTR